MINGNAIEVANLKRYYELRGETVKALDGVSFSASKGEFMTVAGPSGSGKSTLLNVIGALDAPSKGSVRIEGVELGLLSPSDQAKLRRDKIGFVFQSYNLIPVLTALENVEYVMLLQGVPPKERKERSLGMLEEVGLSGLWYRRPAELSGGQQQRVAVARALVSKPAIVLADEPTANLDTVTGGGLIDTMLELNRAYSTTFILSTHDPIVMERSSRLIRMRDGKIESDEQL